MDGCVQDGVWFWDSTKHISILFHHTGRRTNICCEEGRSGRRRATFEGEPQPHQLQGLGKKTRVIIYYHFYMYYVYIYARTSSPTSYTTCIYLPTSINIQTKQTIVQKVSSILFFLSHYPLLVLPYHHSINPVAVMINSYSMYLLDYERLCTYVWEPVSIVACMYRET
jgi:hypothetical protein